MTTRIRSMFGYVAAILALTAFALPSSAAGPAKIFSLVMAPATQPTTQATMTATFYNSTPNGNSVINTVILTPPAGSTNVAASFPNGGTRVTCPATAPNSSGVSVPVPAGSICVASIPSVMKAGCSSPGCNWTFNVSVKLPNSCGINTWAGQAFTGNSFNGDAFEFQSATSNLKTTINSGCSYTIPTAVNPAGGGSVLCTPNPVGYNGSSTCTATPGDGYGFVSFTGACTGTTTSCTLSGVTSQPGTVTANFAQNAISATISPTGSGSVLCTPNPVPYDGNATCTATANTGWGFVGFSGDCSGATCALNNVKAPKTVIATFAQFTIPTAVSPTGTGTVSCDPNPVGYNGSSACTATAKANFTFTGFSGACTGPTCTLNNMTSQPGTVTANFIANTLNFISTPPTSAAVGTPFDVVIGSTPTGADVKVTGCDSSSSKTVTDTGTKFTITINSLPAPPSTCTITFSADNYNPLLLTSFQVYAGVLNCTDFDASYVTNKNVLNPDNDSSFVGPPGWGLLRGKNWKATESACVAVNYTCTLNEASNVGSCVYDKILTDPKQTSVTFKYVLLWKAVRVDNNGGATDVWKDFHPKVSWGIAAPNPDTTSNDWVPGLACVDDGSNFTGIPGSDMQGLLPYIPDVAPFTGNTHAQYRPLDAQGNKQKAQMCIAQQGWTSIGVPLDDPTKILIQFWNKVIDQSDGFVKGPG